MLRSVLLVIAALGAAAVVVAQEGHPLTGTWHGEFRASAGDVRPIVFYMTWDTKNVVGQINPGRNAMPLRVVRLDADKWTVHFEAEAKDGTKVVADGKLSDIGSYHRKITGTWTQGAAKGAFEMSRD